MNIYRYIIVITAFLYVSCSSEVKDKNEAKAPVKGLITDSAMVVSAHPLASKVGVDIMRSGGNAIDAAIAVNFALAVVYPTAGNIGGGGFMVIRLENGEGNTLDFREAAPSGASRDMYLDENGDVVDNLSTRGHLAVGVPGAVDGMVKAHKKYGSLSWESLVQPAIDLARDGFPLTEREAKGLNSNRENFEKYSTVKPEFILKDWKAGDSIKWTGLADALVRIRDKGRAGFYEGQTAQDIVNEMERADGLISLEDLKNYQSVWRAPIKMDYKGYNIISMPPPSSGGLALSQLLSMVEPYDLNELGYHTPASIHLMTEAERRVYADRATHLGDPDFHSVPVEDLINNDYLQYRMTNFNEKEATKSEVIKAGEFALEESEETTHYSIVDSDGNAVSVTTTLNGGYGSKVIVGGSGFLLNNEMDDFSSKPGFPNSYGLVGGEANAIAPGKRMLSSMTPSIVDKDGELFMVVGSPGGSTIITSVFQNIVNVIDHGMSMQESVSAGRIHHQWLPDAVFYETNALDSGVVNDLRSLGHEMKERGPYGKVDAILVLPDGRLEGGADPRGDDKAEGY